MKRVWYGLPFLVTTALLFVYGVFATGKASGSVAFLAVAGGALLESLRLLFVSARSLFTEPPADDVAVATGRRRKELEREKAALLKAIKELEFDHEMGKVSDADHAEIGGVYRARAIRVLRQLDDREVDYARLVEEELAREKKARGIASPASPSAAAAAAAPDFVPSRNTHLCPSCQTQNDADAVFCKKCAKRLQAEALA